MHKLLSALVLISMLAACSDGDSLVGMRGRIFKVVDPAEHAHIHAKLEAEGIEYLVDERGFTVTLIEDQARVDALKREARYGSELRPDVWELVTVMTPEARVAYEAAFTEAGIQYDLRSDDGHLSIHWNQVDGPKVDEILQRIDEEQLRAIINEAKKT